MGIGGYSDKVWKIMVDEEILYSDFVTEMGENRAFEEALKDKSATWMLLAGKPFTYESKDERYLKTVAILCLGIMYC